MGRFRVVWGKTSFGREGVEEYIGTGRLICFGRDMAGE